MKKNLLFAFLAFVAMISVAATRPHMPRPNAKSAKTAMAAMTTMSTPSPAITPQAIGTTAADYESITDWTSRGQVKYTDCITAQAWGTAYYATYDVDLEESESNPGLYRVKNPVLNNPTLYDGDADTSQDYYMIVDCTDPTAVVIPECNYGLIDYTTGSFVYVKSFSSGTVTDSKVSFPDWGIGYMIGESGSYAVASGAGYTFSLSLPGAKDYTMTLSATTLCNAGNTADFTLTPGSDITTMKYAFGTAASLEQARTAGQEIVGGEQSLDITEEGVNVLAVVGYDADGNEQATAVAKFYRYDENADQWITLGTTTMTEDFVEAFYAGSGYGYGPNTFDVTVQENVNTPGFYRIVNPYENNNNSAITSNQYHATDHNHYIFIHAENPDAVTFDESPIGCNFYGMGDMTVTSYESTGTMTNGTITMPAGTLYITMGDYGAYNANDFVLVIPKEHTVAVKSADEKYGSVAITNPETEGNSLTTTASSVTVTATPADGVAFMNWTDAEGNVISTESTYTYVGSDDIELTANFGLTITYTNPENGFITVYNGENIVSSGSIFAPGTVISITVKPKTDDYELQGFYVNEIETAVDSEGKYELTLETSCGLTAIFKEKTYLLHIICEGNGEIQVWTEVDDTEELPAGTRLYDGDTYTGELYVWYIPGEGDNLENAYVTVNDNTQTLNFADETDGLLVTNGEWGKAGNVYFYPATVSKEPVTFSAKFTGVQQGLEEIGIDPTDGPVEYFNLQGIRVSADNLVPGFYIVRQGAKTIKVLVKD